MFVSRSLFLVSFKSKLILLWMIRWWQFKILNYKQCSHCFRWVNKWWQRQKKPRVLSILTQSHSPIFTLVDAEQCVINNCWRDFILIFMSNESEKKKNENTNKNASASENKHIHIETAQKQVIYHFYFDINPSWYDIHITYKRYSWQIRNSIEQVESSRAVRDFIAAITMYSAAKIIILWSRKD